ncbi:Nn.00g046680.m01.CDS01 [Neocucurbitaria sp. VM-36]
MDAAPNCAICNAPAYPECPCEAERLQIAVKQAEQRVMEERLAEIRDWVINHARQHILNAFERLTSTRKQAHSAYLASLPNYEVYMRYSGHPPIHPMYVAQLQTQIAEAHAELKRGIDADWRASVLRYPEILDYFYGLVELRLPNDRSPSVVEPPFAAAGYADRGYTDPSRLSVEKKKKKRRDREGSIPPERHAALHRIMRGPPPVPTPPLQHGAYPRPPGPYPY